MWRVGFFAVIFLLVIQPGDRAEQNRTRVRITLVDYCLLYIPFRLFSCFSLLYCTVKRGKEGRSGTMCCQCLDVFVYFVVVVACMPLN